MLAVFLFLAVAECIQNTYQNILFGGYSLESWGYVSYTPVGSGRGSKDEPPEAESNLKKTL